MLILCVVLKGILPIYLCALDKFTGSAFCGAERISISLCRLAGSLGWLLYAIEGFTSGWLLRSCLLWAAWAVWICILKNLFQFPCCCFRLSGCLFNGSNFHHFSDFKEVGESLFWKRYLFLRNFAGLFAPWRPFRSLLRDKLHEATPHGISMSRNAWFYLVQHWVP